MVLVRVRAKLKIRSSERNWRAKAIHNSQWFLVLAVMEYKHFRDANVYQIPGLIEHCTMYVRQTHSTDIYRIDAFRINVWATVQHIHTCKLQDRKEAFTMVHNRGCLEPIVRIGISPIWDKISGSNTKKPCLIQYLSPNTQFNLLRHDLNRVTIASKIAAHVEGANKVSDWYQCRQTSDTEVVSVSDMKKMYQFVPSSHPTKILHKSYTKLCQHSLPLVLLIKSMHTGLSLQVNSSTQLCGSE